MEFDNTFTVAAPIDEVWAAILDLERVAPCVPGAQVLEQTGDNAYKVAIKIKLGPMSMTYRGDVEIVEHDDAEHRAKMNAKAKETRGQGTANAGVEMRLAEENGATTGTIHSDVAISGKAASMGQGVIADVSGRLVDTFAANLAAMLAGPAAEEPAAAATPGATPPPPGVASPAADEGLPILSIVGKVLAQRLRDPRIAVPALVALVLLLRALRRRG